jgi:hypothetical protein
MKFAGLCCALALAWLESAAALAAAPPEMYSVPLPVSAPRLLGMSMDDDGFIWLGSTNRAIWRYDPRTGAIEEVKLPFDSSTSQTICVGEKVYLLGQKYPKLMCYDRQSRSFSELAYPTATPDVWYGTELVDDRYLYLFDRGTTGVIKWDTQTDAGTVIHYDFDTPMPSSGTYVAEDGAVWCGVWDIADGQYIPRGLARLDAATNQFTDWRPFPSLDAVDPPVVNHETTIYYPYTLKGKLVPFDWKARRWRRMVDAPGFGERFGFIGGGKLFQGRWYFPISTYNGTPIGVDGKPHHFCNGPMAYDPATGEFSFPTLDGKDAYYQVSYHLVAGGHFFATGNNIRQADGSLDHFGTGQAAFLQTLKPAAASRE